MDRESMRAARPGRNRRQNSSRPARKTMAWRSTTRPDDGSATWAVMLAMGRRKKSQPDRRLPIKSPATKMPAGCVNDLEHRTGLRSCADCLNTSWMLMKPKKRRTWERLYMRSGKTCWTATSQEKMPSIQRSKNTKKNRSTKRRNRERRSAGRRKRAESRHDAKKGDAGRRHRLRLRQTAAAATVIPDHPLLGVPAHRDDRRGDRRIAGGRKAPPNHSSNGSMGSATSRARSRATGYAAKDCQKVPTQTVEATTGGSIETSSAAKADRSDFAGSRRSAKMRRGRRQRGTHRASGTGRLLVTSSRRRWMRGMGRLSPPLRSEDGSVPHASVNPYSRASRYFCGSAD